MENSSVRQGGIFDSKYKILSDVWAKTEGNKKMKRDELLLKAAANMRRPCSAGVMIDRRVLLLLLRLRAEKRKKLDKPAEK